jgi:serine/threonine protein kinase
MFMPVLTTIEALHSNGIIHGAICPDTLVLCRDGKVRLKGFSITEANVENSNLKFNEQPGYTALEQYNNNHKLCPATDIYAFSACIFRALVGQNPPNAKEREVNDKLMIPNSIAEKIPTHIIKALGGGLQVYPEKRTQTVEQFRELLNASPSVVAASTPKITDENDPVKEEKHYRGYPVAEPKKSSSGGAKVVAIVLIILIIIAVAGGAYVVKSGILDRTPEDTSTTDPVASYTVPDFITAGYTQSDIQNNGAWNKQFKISYTSEFSVDAEEGIIFKQSVDAGETVDEGTEIVLTVSKGVETEEVPNVGGLTLEEATKQLKAKGFTVSTVEIYNDGDYTPNTVKSSYGMAPKAGSVVAVGEEIILQVYGEVQTTTQPDTTDDDTSTSDTEVDE